MEIEGLRVDTGAEESGVSAGCDGGGVSPSTALVGVIVSSSAWLGEVDEGSLAPPKRLQTTHSTSFCGRNPL